MSEVTNCPSIIRDNEPAYRIAHPIMEEVILKSQVSTRDPGNITNNLGSSSHLLPVLNDQLKASQSALMTREAPRQNDFGLSAEIDVPRTRNLDIHQGDPYAALYSGQRSGLYKHTAFRICPDQ